MSRIVNNRICFTNHNVVLDPSVHAARPDYIFELAEVLTQGAKPSTHLEELEAFTSIPCYAIERPDITIVPFHNSEGAERMGLIPTRMLCTATLFNGNYNHIIAMVHCNRSESFQPIWQTLHKSGITVPTITRRAVETKYFELYDQAVATYNARQADPACNI